MLRKIHYFCFDGYTTWHYQIKIFAENGINVFKDRLKMNTQITFRRTWHMWVQFFLFLSYPTSLFVIAPYIFKKPACTPDHGSSRLHVFTMRSRFSSEAFWVFQSRPAQGWQIGLICLIELSKKIDLELVTSLGSLIDWTPCWSDAAACTDNCW